MPYKDINRELLMKFVTINGIMRKKWIAYKVLIYSSNGTWVASSTWMGYTNQEKVKHLDNRNNLDKFTKGIYSHFVGSMLI